MVRYFTVYIIVMFLHFLLCCKSQVRWSANTRMLVFVRFTSFSITFNNTWKYFNIIRGTFLYVSYLCVNVLLLLRMNGQFRYIMENTKENKLNVDFVSFKQKCLDMHLKTCETYECVELMHASKHLSKWRNASQKTILNVNGATS